MASLDESTRMTTAVKSHTEIRNVRLGHHESLYGSG